MILNASRVGHLADLNHMDRMGTIDRVNHAAGRPSFIEPYFNALSPAEPDFRKFHDTFQERAARSRTTYGGRSTDQAVAEGMLSDIMEKSVAWHKAEFAADYDGDVFRPAGLTPEAENAKGARAAKHDPEADTFTPPTPWGIK